MKAYEIITEKISITHFTEQFEDAFIHSIRQTISELASRKKALESFRDEVNGNKDTGPTLKPIEGALLAEAYTSLVYYLSDNLMKVCNQIADHEVLVDIVQMGDMGNANYGRINLSDKYAESIVRQLLLLLKESAFGSFSEDSFFDYYFSHLKGRYVQEYLPFEIQIGDAINTMVHEMVHVLQRQRQTNTGKFNPAGFEYRSYLSDPKKNVKVRGRDRSYNSDELRNMNISRNGPGPDENRFLYLHAGSPQEMASYAHEFALNIIRDYNLNERNPTDAIHLIDTREFYHDMIDLVKSRIKPETPAEEKVFRRYLKLTYQELDRYIDAKRAEVERMKKVRKTYDY